MIAEDHEVDEYLQYVKRIQKAQEELRFRLDLGIKAI